MGKRKREKHVRRAYDGRYCNACHTWTAQRASEDVHCGSNTFARTELALKTGHVLPQYKKQSPEKDGKNTNLSPMKPESKSKSKIQLPSAVSQGRNRIEVGFVTRGTDGSLPTTTGIISFLRRLTCLRLSASLCETHCVKLAFLQCILLVRRTPPVRHKKLRFKNTESAAGLVSEALCC